MPEQAQSCSSPKILRNHIGMRDVGVAEDDFPNLASGAREDMDVATIPALT